MSYRRVTHCKYCEKQFTALAYQQKYCSVECRNKWWNDNHNRKNVEKECVICGETFISPKGNWKTCSPECKEAHFKATNEVWQYRYAASEKGLERRKQHYLENAEEIKTKTKEYHFNKMKTDPNYRMLFRLRQRLQAAVKQGFTSEWLLEVLGCSLEELRDHLQETAIVNGYVDFNIDDYSGEDYHIDHIKPCAKFNLLEEKDQRECFNFENLQILTAKANRKKSAKYIES